MAPLTNSEIPLFWLGPNLKTNICIAGDKLYHLWYLTTDTDISHIPSNFFCVLQQLSPGLTNLPNK